MPYFFLVIRAEANRKEGKGRFKRARHLRPVPVGFFRPAEAGPPSIGNHNVPSISDHAARVLDRPSRRRFIGIQFP